MCTVKEIQEAIREDCKSQHDMESLSPRRSHLQRRVLESRCFGSMQENLKSVEHRNSLE